MPRLIFDEKAEADLDGIYDYIGIENQSPAAADEFIEAIDPVCEGSIVTENETRTTPRGMRCNCPR